MMSVAVQCYFPVHFWAFVLVVPSEAHFTQARFAWISPGHPLHLIWLSSVSCKPFLIRCPSPARFAYSLPRTNCTTSELFTCPSPCQVCEGRSRILPPSYPQFKAHTGHSTDKCWWNEVLKMKWDYAGLAHASQNTLGTRKNTYPLCTLSVGALAPLKFSPNPVGRLQGRKHRLWKQNAWVPILPLPLTSSMIDPICASVSSPMKWVIRLPWRLNKLLLA